MKCNHRVLNGYDTLGLFLRRSSVRRLQYQSHQVPPNLPAKDRIFPTAVFQPLILLPWTRTNQESSPLQKCLAKVSERHSSEGKIHPDRLMIYIMCRPLGTQFEMSSYYSLYLLGMYFYILWSPFWSRFPFDPTIIATSTSFGQVSIYCTVSVRRVNTKVPITITGTPYWIQPLPADFSDLPASWAREKTDQ